MSDADDQPEVNLLEGAVPEDTAAGPRLTQLTELLIEAGIAPKAAPGQARRMLESLNTVSAGSTWGGVHAEFVSRLIDKAMRQGHRRVVLEIEAEGERDEWFGHLSVTVREAQFWSEWEAQRREDAEKELN